MSIYQIIDMFGCKFLVAAYSLQSALQLEALKDVHVASVERIGYLYAQEQERAQ